MELTMKLTMESLRKVLNSKCLVVISVAVQRSSELRPVDTGAQQGDQESEIRRRWSEGDPKKAIRRRRSEESYPKKVLSRKWQVEGVQERVFTEHFLLDAESPVTAVHCPSYKQSHLANRRSLAIYQWDQPVGPTVFIRGRFTNDSLANWDSAPKCVW